jgi:2-C-methyl-D-erythritol 4-phosphate cytidylyltransferase
VQTPQIFRYDLIRRAYDRIQNEDRTGVTDDAMVLERMGEVPVRMYRGSYMNIKITTPEDLAVAAEFIREREKLT